MPLRMIEVLILKPYQGGYFVLELMATIPIKASR